MMTQDNNAMPDIYEAIVSLAKVDKEFAEEIDPGGHYWGQHLESSVDQGPPVEVPGINWPTLCAEYLEACELDDPCRQIDALNAILNAAAEFDARRLPKWEELEVFTEEHWGSMCTLRDWPENKTVQIMHEIVHINHFIDFANEVLVRFGGLR